MATARRNTLTMSKLATATDYVQELIFCESQPLVDGTLQTHDHCGKGNMHRIVAAQHYTARPIAASHVRFTGMQLTRITGSDMQSIHTASTWSHATSASVTKM